MLISWYKQNNTTHPKGPSYFGLFSHLGLLYMHMHRDYSSYVKKITWMSWGPGDPRKHTSRHIIIALPKINNKERILKAAREKETVTY